MSYTNNHSENYILKLLKKTSKLYYLHVYIESMLYYVIAQCFSIKAHEILQIHFILIQSHVFILFNKTYNMKLDDADKERNPWGNKNN